MAFQLSDLSNLYNQVAGYTSAAQNAGNVNGIAAQQQGALNGQYSSLQNQLAQATSQYATDRGNLDQTNSGLRDQMGNIQSQIAGLSDPNSAYMQQSRQGIERKDAAAGRNSQWGDREVQLAALLAENQSKYAPGLQAQYTNAANSISDNESKLNRQYQDALNGFNSQYLGLIDSGNRAAGTAGGAQQQANNQQSNAGGNLLRNALSGLGGMFNFSGNNTGDGITNWASGAGGLGTGSLGSAYGSSLSSFSGGGSPLSYDAFGSGLGSYNTGSNPYGYGLSSGLPSLNNSFSLPSGGYDFGGSSGGITGLMSGLGLGGSSFGGLW